MSKEQKNSGVSRKVGENWTKKETNDVFFRRGVAENWEGREQKKEVISREKNRGSGIGIFSFRRRGVSARERLDKRKEKTEAWRARFLERKK